MVRDIFVRPRSFQLVQFGTRRAQVRAQRCDARLAVGEFSLQLVVTADRLDIILLALALRRIQVFELGLDLGQFGSGNLTFDSCLADSRPDHQSPEREAEQQAEKRSCGQGHPHVCN